MLGNTFSLKKHAGEFGICQRMCQRNTLILHYSLWKKTFQVEPLQKINFPKIYEFFRFSKFQSGMPARWSWNFMQAKLLPDSRQFVTSVPYVKITSFRFPSPRYAHFKIFILYATRMECKYHAGRGTAGFPTTCHPSLCKKKPAFS